MSSVICDLCSRDFTNSPQKGGLVLGSTGICPVCEPRMVESLKKEGELEHVTEWCAKGESYADFIRRFRAQQTPQFKQLVLEHLVEIDSQEVADYIMSEKTQTAKSAMDLLRIQLAGYDPAGFGLLKSLVASCKNEMEEEKIKSDVALFGTGYGFTNEKGELKHIPLDKIIKMEKKD